MEVWIYISSREERRGDPPLHKVAAREQPIYLVEFLVTHHKPSSRGSVLCPPVQDGATKVVSAGAQREGEENHGALQLHGDEVEEGLGGDGDGEGEGVGVQVGVRGWLRGGG